MKKLNQRIIVFTGPDMSGKTEIAKQLSRVTGIPYFKASTEHKTFLNSQSDFLSQLQIADMRMLDFLEQTGHSVIFDRAWPCEFVYSKFFQRATDMNALRLLDERMSKMNSKIVICYRESYEGIQDDIDSRLTSSKLVELRNLYLNDFSSWTNNKVLKLQVDDEDLQRELDEIFHFLNEDDHD